MAAQRVMAKDVAHERHQAVRPLAPVYRLRRDEQTYARWKTQHARARANTSRNLRRFCLSSLGVLAPWRPSPSFFNSLLRRLRNDEGESGVFRSARSGEGRGGWL